MAAIQAVLMLFRQAALVVLAGVLPLAAAGALAPATRAWFRRTTGWMLALIFYKPAAAAVYATAFALLGRGKDPRTVLMGFAMVLLSLLALPVLMRFFTWTTGSVEASGGGGLLGTVLSGAIAIGAVRGSSFGGIGGLSAADQARLLTGQLGPPGGTGPPGADGSPGVPGPQGAAAGDAAAPFGVPAQGPPGAGTGTATSAAGAGVGTTAATGGTAAASAGAAAASGGVAAGAAAAGGPVGVAAAAVAEGGPGGPRGGGGNAPAGDGEWMTAQEHPQRPREYGGWRRRRGIGLWGLGAAGTITVLAAAAITMLVGVLDARLLVFTLPAVLLAGGLGLARVSGEPIALLGLRRLRWWHASARGHTKYRMTAAADQPGWFSLPGVLSTTALLSADDGCGSRYGIIWDRRTGLLTPTVGVAPASTWLAERPDADNWIANWGGWLASLGHSPMLRWVTVTVDSAPEPGSALADAAATAVDPASPAAARAILALLVAAAPSAAAHVETLVSLTFDLKASPVAPKNLTEAVAEVGPAMLGLEPALGGCGAAVLGRLRAPEIAGIVRAAFDPAARGEVLRLAALAGADREAAELGWPEAAPFAAEEFPDHYRHDSGISVSWAWQEAPRQNVTADVLARLLMPGPYPKRVSLQYRPFTAGAATQVLEAEVNAASFRAHYRHRTGREETARDTYDQARARQAAAEEAAGAGVCLMSLFVTVTVIRPGELPRAVAWTEAAAGASKIRLRRMAYSQAAGFAATLPCGICPAELARRLLR